MTENSVQVSITINGFGKGISCQRRIALQELESSIGRITQEMGNSLLQAGIEELNRRIRQTVPGSWQNVGTERRGVLSSLGMICYQRRIYVDKKGRRRIPVDEVLGVGHYGRDSLNVREMGAYLACTGSYRRAASQLSWLVKGKVSQSASIVWGKRWGVAAFAKRRQEIDRSAGRHLV